MFFHKEKKKLQTIVYLGDKANKLLDTFQYERCGIKASVMKITKNTSYLLKFPLNKKRRGQHISTLLFPVFIAITEVLFFFFLISKTVEKPNSHNQHFSLNHCF